MEPTAAKYRAFLSYSWTDHKIASRLHADIDRYRTPKSLVGTRGTAGPVPALLHPIFRDRDDFSAGGELSKKVREALLDSEALIVLCSPAAASSEWVNHEVRAFIESGRSDRIFPVIASGLPDTKDVENAFFPPALRGRDLLAADLREIKQPDGRVIGDGADVGRMKLIAGLLGVGLDTLIARERKRARQKSAILTLVALAFAAIAVIALVQRQRAVEKENLARETLLRTFINQAWNRVDRKNYAASARYALAGYTLLSKTPNGVSGQDRERFRTVLATAMQAAGESSSQLVHSKPLRDSVFISAGTRILTSDAEGTVHVWDATNMRLRSTIRSGDRNLKIVCASPHRNWFVLLRETDNAQVWDENGKLVAELTGQVGTVHPVACHPDGALIVTGSSANDNIAKIWSLPQGRLSMKLVGHAKHITGAAFSPKGNLVVTASTDMTAKVWRTQDGKPVATLDHDDEVRAAAFSSNEKLLATASDKGIATVWDATSFKRRHVLRGHKDRIDAIQFSRDDTRLLTNSWDKSSKLWNAVTGELIADLVGETESLSNTTMRSSFSNDGEQIIGASGVDSFSVWSAADGRLIHRVFGHEGAVQTARFSPDGKSALTSGNDRTARVWKDLRGRLIATLKHDQNVDSVAFAPDGTQVLTGSWDNTARLWNVADGNLIRTFPGHADTVTGVAFFRDGRRFVTGSNDRTARIWSVAHSEPVAILSGHTENIWNIGLSPDDNYIGTASFDKTAKIWDSSGKLVQTLTNKDERVASVVFMPDRSSVSTATFAGTVHTWRLSDGKLLRTSSLSDASILVAALAPDGSSLLTAGIEATPRISRSNDGHLIATLEGHIGEIVRSATYSRDGTRIGTSGFDRYAKIWESAEGHLLTQLGPHGEAIASIAFSPDGTRAATAGWDGYAKIWEIERLAQSWDRLAHDACMSLLGSSRRLFSVEQIAADPLLRSEWSDPKRDVCEAVEGANAHSS